MQFVKRVQFIKRKLRWILAGWIAFVFVQSLFFKFTGSHETTHIFGVLGEWLSFPLFAQYGGIVIGVMELITSIFLFTRWWPWASVLAFEIMTAAILFHLFTPLGIVMPVFDQAGNIVGDDGGTLFVMACLTFAASAGLIVKDWLSEDSQLRRLIKSK